MLSVRLTNRHENIAILPVKTGLLFPIKSFIIGGEANAPRGHRQTMSFFSAHLHKISDQSVPITPVFVQVFLVGLGIERTVPPHA
jgi:hypothetical protein